MEIKRKMNTTYVWTSFSPIICLSFHHLLAVHIFSPACPYIFTTIIDEQILFLKKHGIEAVVLNAISVAHVERESDNEEDGTKTFVDRD